MDVPDKWFTLLAVFAGAIIGEFSGYFARRREKKRVIGRLITHLLNCRFYIRRTKFLGEWVEKHGGVEARHQLLTLLDRLLPTDELHDDYKTCISDLAATNPILAYELAGKDTVIPYLQRARMEMKSSLEIAMWPQMESELSNTIADDLNELIKKLCWRRGIFTRLQLLFMRRKTDDEVRADLEKFISSFLKNAGYDPELLRTSSPNP
jgi:hypothetical protein